MRAGSCWPVRSRTPATLDAIRDALAMPLLVVRLEVPLEVVEARLGGAPTRGRADDLARAREWFAAGPGVELEDAVLDGTLPVATVAERVLELAGWHDRRSAPPTGSDARGTMRPCGSTTSSWSGSSRATSSRSATCCAPRTSRAGRWRTCSSSPTPSPPPCGATCAWATREAPGHPLLRAEIASLYDEVAPDEVLVFSGAEEAIFIVANVLLGPGDHAIVMWPAYQSLHEVARATGADVTLHELRAEDGWAIDVEALRAQVTPRTKLIVVNVPHNPTGYVPDAATYDAIADIAADAGATLLSDEVYRFLEHPGTDRLPAGAEVGPHGVSVGVMSKSFALAGLRIGWLATHDAGLLDRAARFKDYTTICASAPAEILGLIALRARDEVLARSRGIVDAQPRAAGRVLRAPGRPDRAGPGRAAGRSGSRRSPPACRSTGSPRSCSRPRAC